MKPGRGITLAVSLAAAAGSALSLSACSEGYSPPSAGEQRITVQRDADFITELGRGTLTLVNSDDEPKRVRFGGNTTTLPGRFGQQGVEDTISTNGTMEADLPAQTAGVPACLQGDVAGYTEVIVAGTNSPDAEVTLDTF